MTQRRGSCGIARPVTECSQDSYGVSSSTFNGPECSGSMQNDANGFYNHHSHISVDDVNSNNLMFQELGFHIENFFQ